MPQYQTHAKFNCFIALPLALFVLWYFFDPPQNLYFIFSLSFIYSTLFMNPDLDLANKIKLFSLRGLLSLPFRSYCYFFRHRGLSHSVLLGTTTRLLWLGGFILLGYYLAYHTVVEKKTLKVFFYKNQATLLIIFAGIFLADIAHIFLDKNAFFKRR